MMSLLQRSYPATADLSTKYGYAVALSSTGITVPTVQGQDVIGLLTNKPESGQTGNVGMVGVFQGKLGGTVAINDPLAAASDGSLVRWRPGDTKVGKALEAGVSGDLIDVFVDPMNPFDQYFTANDTMATAIAVAAHTVAGEVDIPDAGQEIVGITQAAVSAGSVVKVRTFGVSSFTAGTGGVAVGAVLESDTAGKLITKGDGSAGANLCAVALAAVAQDEVGLCFIKPLGTTIS